MFRSLPPFVFIIWVSIAAVLSLCIFVRSIIINAHISAKVFLITVFFFFIVEAVIKSIESFFFYLSDYLNILEGFQEVLSAIAFVLLFYMMFRFGDEKRKGLTIIVLIFAILFFGLYIYLSLFYKG